MNRKFRAIVVDDERLARRELRSLLAVHPEIQLAGEAASVDQAVTLIREAKPDVVFLDIQMPGESGFELLNKVEATFKIIFVTAYDTYAIRAFEVNALDYLLKPINPERLAKAIERLSLGEPSGERRVGKLDYDDHLFLTTDKRPRFMKVSAIECVCAAGDYTEVFTADGKKSLIHQALKEWEERLPEKYFVRIFRSTIINLEYVDRVEASLNYSYRVYLRNIPEPFTMSRRHAAQLKMCR